MSKRLSKMPPTIYHLTETTAALLTFCTLLENGYVIHKTIYTHIAFVGAPNVTMDHDSDVIMDAMASQITRRLECVLNRLLRRSSMKTSKFHVTVFSGGNPPMTGELFPNSENVCIWWRHDWGIRGWGGVGGGVGIGALHNKVSCKASWHILKLLYVDNNEDKFHRIFTFVCNMGDEVSYSMEYGIAKKMSHHIFVQKFYPSASFSILTNTHVAVDIYRVRVEHRWHLINELKAHNFIFIKTTRSKLILI